jgi:hypothetical protein
MSQYSAEFIAKRLEKPQRSGKGWRCCCPAHDDKEPSFDIEDGDKGPVFICRSARCSQTAIIKALRGKGLWLDGAQPKKPRAKRSAPDDSPAKPKRRLSLTYDYVDDPVPPS